MKCCKGCRQDSMSCTRLPDCGRSRWRNWHGSYVRGSYTRYRAKAYCGNVLIENRNGLVVDTELLQANGTAERDAALLMSERIGGSKRVTVAADRGYDAKEFGQKIRGMNVTPHVAQDDNRRGGSAIDGRTTRHAGYTVS